MLFRKILLPVDNSAGAAAAVDYAKQIAWAERAELYLLHVTKERQDRPHRYDWPPEAYVSWDRAIPPPRRMILPGTPSQTIIAFADHIDADLIIMPTRGHGILGQLFFGSTTMDVIRGSARMVWAVKTRSPKYDGPFRRQRIVCGIDVNAEGQAVLSYAAAVAAAWNAALVVAHAIPGMSNAMLERYGLDERDDVALLPEAARRKIRSLAVDIMAPFTLDVSIDDPAACLRRAVKKHCADLLIIGRGRRNRTPGGSPGAHVGETIARSLCPVMTVPPRHSTRLTHSDVRQARAGALYGMESAGRRNASIQ